jgi:pseudouridine-5'-phosphate glycosidase
MMDDDRLSKYFSLSNEVVQARKLGLPLVALESAVITHGLPHPANLEMARDVENAVRSHAAVPATIALFGGKIHVGLTGGDLDMLATAEQVRKISRRDFSIALARQETGGTTVAATLYAAHAAGIRVFSTGGIGGVHRGAPHDISADLPELGQRPLVVVCAGAKSILDLPATLEVLETNGVPVVGYQTDEFPAFYARTSGLPVNVRLDTPEEAASLAETHWGLGLTSAILVVQPPPPEACLPADKIEAVIQRALDEAARQGIQGAAVTPFLLAKVSSLTRGASLRSNLALLRHNAILAAQIAGALAQRRRKMI